MELLLQTPVGWNADLIIRRQGTVASHEDTPHPQASPVSSQPPSREASVRLAQPPPRPTAPPSDSVADAPHPIAPPRRPSKAAETVRAAGPEQTQSSKSDDSPARQPVPAPRPVPAARKPAS
jgi:hypothetical protein